MADAKKKPILAKTVTPKGVFVFPYFNKPDTKFKAEGEFRVKLRLEGADAEALKALIDKAQAAAFEQIKSEEPAPAKRAKIKQADLPYQPELDKETGEPTGATLFTFKQKARIENKKTKEVFEKKIDLFDAAGKRIDPKKTLIYGGSTGKIAFEAWPFYTVKVGAGVTLRLLAAQVIDLRSGGSRDADDYGFGSEGEGLGDNDATGEDDDTDADDDAGSSDF